MKKKWIIPVALILIIFLSPICFSRTSYTHHFESVCENCDTIKDSDKSRQTFTKGTQQSFGLLTKGISGFENRLGLKSKKILNLGIYKKYKFEFEQSTNIHKLKIKTTSVIESSSWGFGISRFEQLNQLKLYEKHLKKNQTTLAKELSEKYNL